MKRLLKKLLFISILIASNTNINAQVNLVQDGSFEDTIAGWQNNAGTGTLRNWFALDSIYSDSTAGKMPWYLFSIYRLKYLDWQMPFNQFFVQYARSGHNVVAMTLVNKQINRVNSRSILKQRLPKSLVAGKQYCVTLYAVASEIYGDYFTNGLAVYFDNGQLDTMVQIHKDTTGIYPFVQPQLQCNFFINDTANWMRLQGTFIANGTESYINVGNFLSDSATQKQYINYLNLFNGQEILIDDISVIPVDIKDWLHDTACAFGDSVWVGLPQFDYKDGKWYDSNMQYISTGAGFWYKPTMPVTKFIQSIEVCGVIKYDTVNVYMFPSSINNEIKNKYYLNITPNPALNNFIVSGVPSNTKIYLINTLGEVVQSQISNNSMTQFDISALPKGVYFVRCDRQMARVLVE